MSAIADLRLALTGWYADFHRDLPWRETKDPYKIWVSEIMLQQTQVVTVIPYYHRFIETLPDIAALAQAEEQTVLHLWAGLGYYSRARNLQAAAKKIMQAHQGCFPRQYEAVRSLPGVGEYTAGAICSIAFGLPVPAVDGNVERVITRLFYIEENPRRNPGREQVREYATELARGPEPGQVNQALMELGATLCRPASPVCFQCPLGEFCIAKAEDAQERLPVLPQRTAMSKARTAGMILQANGCILVAQRPAGAVWGGLWEFPQVETPSLKVAPKLLAEFIQDSLGLQVEVGEISFTVKHGVMNRNITLDAYHCRLISDNKMLTVNNQVYSAVRWISVNDLHTIPLSSPHQKIAKFVIAKLNSETS